MHSINIHTAMGESTFNRFHGRVLFWCVLILIIDGYDLAVVGAALPAIMQDMQVDPTSAGIMAGSALLGTMMGAIFLGTLADRIGRPRMIAICVALFSVFSALAGLTHDPVSFSIARFIAGLGIGGVMPACTAQMGEYSPLKLRVRLIAVVFAGYSVGGIVVALTAKHMIEVYGWQGVFYVAGLPIVLIPLILKSLPHSIDYLLKTNRQDELRSIMRSIKPDTPVDDDVLITGDGAAHPSQPVSVKGLFDEGRGFSTLMIWMAFMTGLFTVYALNSWLTKLMAMAGFSLGSALNFFIVLNLGSIAGGVAGGWLSDKFNIKYVLMSFYTVGAITLTLLGYTRDTALLFLVVFLVGASTLGTMMLSYAFAGNFYPSNIRSTGVGFASGVGRIGAIIAPVLIGWLVSLALPLQQNFMAIGVACLIGALAVSLINQSRAQSHLEKKSLAPSAQQ